MCFPVRHSATREGRGHVVIFRYGALALVGLSSEEEQFVRECYTQGPVIEEENIDLAIRPDGDEGVAGDAGLQIRALTPAHGLVAADILAKSIACPL